MVGSLNMIILIGRAMAIWKLLPNNSLYLLGM